MTRGRYKEKEYVHTTINMSKDLHDWLSEQIVKKGYGIKTRIIEDALRDYIATVDRDSLPWMLERCREWCIGSSCEECPILESCSKYLKAETLASFALEGIMDISNRKKKMKRANNEADT